MGWWRWWWWVGGGGRLRNRQHLLALRLKSRCGAKYLHVLAYGPAIDIWEWGQNGTTASYEKGRQNGHRLTRFRRKRKIRPIDRKLNKTNPTTQNGANTDPSTQNGENTDPTTQNGETFDPTTPNGANTGAMGGHMSGVRMIGEAIRDAIGTTQSYGGETDKYHDRKAITQMGGSHRQFWPYVREDPGGKGPCR